MFGQTRDYGSQDFFGLSLKVFVKSFDPTGIAMRMRNDKYFERMVLVHRLGLDIPTLGPHPTVWIVKG